MLNSLFYCWYVFLFVVLFINCSLSLRRKAVWEVKCFELLSILKWVYSIFALDYLDIKFQVRENFSLVFSMALFHCLLVSNILSKSPVSIWFTTDPWCGTCILSFSSAVVRNYMMTEVLSYWFCWTRISEPFQCRIILYYFFDNHPLITTVILVMIYFWNFY